MIIVHHYISSTTQSSYYNEVIQLLLLLDTSKQVCRIGTVIPNNYLFYIGWMDAYLFYLVLFVFYRTHDRQKKTSKEGQMNKWKDEHINTECVRSACSHLHGVYMCTRMLGRGGSSITTGRPDGRVVIEKRLLFILDWLSVCILCALWSIIIL